MNIWGDYVRSGKATSEQESAVRGAYEHYQKEVMLAISIGRATIDDPATPQIVEAANLLTTLIQRYKSS